MGKKFIIIGALLGFIAAFYAFAPEERISSANSVFRRLLNDPGQTCFDYIANELNDPKSAYFVTSNHTHGKVQITYRAKNMVGAYISGSFTCYIGLDGTIGQTEKFLMETDELNEKINRFIESAKDK